MGLLEFCKIIASEISNIENKITECQKFTAREMNEILQNARKENVQYFQSLSKIKKISAFDISFLLSSVKLDEKRVEIIKHAAEMYDEREFQGQGQTFSDFIFRVASNIELLSEQNLELFKDLAQNKNDVYDFSKILKNPAKYLEQNKTSELKFAFQRVFY